MGCLLALGVGILPALRSEALSFSRVPSLEEVAAQAPLAFRGLVLEVDYGSAAVGEGQTLPYTRTTFRILTPFHGCKKGEKVDLLRLGGRRADNPDRYLLIPGLAVLTEGEEVVVFSDDREHPFFGTLYGDQFVYRVASTGGERVVLSHGWSPFAETPDGFVKLIDRRCVPNGEDRRKCRIEEVAGAPVEDDQDGPDAEPVREARPSRMLSPERFDDHVRELAGISRASVVAAQRISGDAETFRRALRALANHNKPALDRMLGKERQ